MRTLRNSLRAFGAVAANRDLLRLEAAWAGSILGTWGYQVAVAVYAYRAGGATAVGAVGFARLAAAAILSPGLAVLADRYPRRSVMVCSDATRVAALGAAAAVVWSGGPALVVYALVVVAGLAASAFRPAQAAILPSLARTPAELTAANVVSSTLESLGIFGGPALGGVLLAFTSVGTVLVATAAALAWSVALVLAIRGEPERPVPEPGRSLRHELAAGFAAIGRTPGVRVVVGLAAAQSFAAGFVTVVVVVLALRTLELGNAGVGWLNAAIGVGGVLGGLVTAGLVGRRRLGGDLAVGIVVWGVPLVLLGVWTSTATALVLFAAAGIANTLVDVSAFSLLQRTAADEVLARVFGVLESLILVSVAIGSIVAAPLIDGLGLRGALVLVGAAVAALVVPALRPLAALDRATPAPERELELLRGVPMLAPLAAPELEGLAAALVRVEVAAGAAAVSQGELGERFYVVDSGHARVEIDGRPAGELGPGGFFGEIALLRDVPRTATVRALEPLRLYALDRAPFLAAVTGHAGSAEAAERVVGSRLARPVRA